MGICSGPVSRHSKARSSVFSVFVTVYIKNRIRNLWPEFILFTFLNPPKGLASATLGETQRAAVKNVRVPLYLPGRYTYAVYMQGVGVSVMYDARMSNARGKSMHREDHGDERDTVC